MSKLSMFIGFLWFAVILLAVMTRNYREAFYVTCWGFTGYLRGFSDGR